MPDQARDSRRYRATYGHHRPGRRRRLYLHLGQRLRDHHRPGPGHPRLRASPQAPGAGIALALSTHRSTTHQPDAGPRGDTGCRLLPCPHHPRCRSLIDSPNPLDAERNLQCLPEEPGDGDGAGQQRRYRRIQGRADRPSVSSQDATSWPSVQAEGHAPVGLLRLESVSSVRSPLHGHPGVRMDGPAYAGVAAPPFSSTVPIPPAARRGAYSVRISCGTPEHPSVLHLGGARSQPRRERGQGGSGSAAAVPVRAGLAALTATCQEVSRCVTASAGCTGPVIQAKGLDQLTQRRPAWREIGGVPATRSGLTSNRGATMARKRPSRGDPERV